MFKIDKNNRITITKGDNACFTIGVKERQLFDDDIITFTVKQVPSMETAIVKQAVNGMIELLPADTDNLAAGRYVYDVQLNTFTGKVYTIIGTSAFIIEEGVSL